MNGSSFAVIFDHTALLALGSGSTMLSGLVSTAHTEPDQYAYTPALCLAAAIALRPGLADHVGLLPSMQVVELDYAGAAAVGGFVASGVDWRAAQAITVGRPTLDWPGGRPVLTSSPDTYTGWNVQVVPFSA